MIREKWAANPKIYHGKHTCHNTPGFDWYVTQHYALKANVGDKLAEHFLTLAELAYPHYVEVIGSEPPNRATTRMVIVHAKDQEGLQKAVSDVGVPWVGKGEGVTLPASHAAYNYPSGSLRYHRNDLSLHEGMHLFELVVMGEFCTPALFSEGIAYTLANHVYDPAKRQLTVAVFDKAPINNPVDAGLRLVQEKSTPKIEDLLRNEAIKNPNGGHGTVHGLFLERSRPLDEMAAVARRVVWRPLAGRCTPAVGPGRHRTVVWRILRRTGATVA